MVIGSLYLVCARLWCGSQLVDVCADRGQLLALLRFPWVCGKRCCADRLQGNWTDLGSCQDRPVAVGRRTACVVRCVVRMILRRWRSLHRRRMSASVVDCRRCVEQICGNVLLLDVWRAVESSTVRVTVRRLLNGWSRVETSISLKQASFSWRHGVD